MNVDSTRCTKACQQLQVNLVLEAVHVFSIPMFTTLLVDHFLSAVHIRCTNSFCNENWLIQNKNLPCYRRSLRLLHGLSEKELPLSHASELPGTSNVRLESQCFVPIVIPHND